MLIGYVDLHAALNSVNHNSLWLLLQRLGIPHQLVALTKDLSSHTFSCVRIDGLLSDWFEVTGGVRQGCTIASSLFVLLMDRMVHSGFLGARSVR